MGMEATRSMKITTPDPTKRHDLRYAADAVAEIVATAEALFDCLDDQASLGAHMEKRSAMMLGGRMT